MVTGFLVIAAAGYGWLSSPFASLPLFLLLVLMAMALSIAWFHPESARWVLASTALTSAFFSSNDAVYLSWWVVGMVLLAVLDDDSARPFVGVIAGVLGAVGGSLVLRDVHLMPLLATGAGYLVASVLRYRSRTVELSAQARALRGQTEWLEQRTALARELHDVVGHHVTAMVVQAEAGQVSNPQAALETIAESGRTTLSELDALVVHLRDPHAGIELSAPPQLPDIDELLAQPLRSQGVHVEVNLDHDLLLDEATTLAVYRIAQEGMTNIARHAQALTAWIDVECWSEGVRLRISDDGVGPPGTVERGSGLRGIAERAGALGGTWDLSARPGGGAMLVAVFPISTVRR